MKRSVVSLSLFVLLVMAVVAGSVATTCAEEIEISIIVQPKTIVLTSESEWLTVHTNIALSAVDTGSLILNGLAVSWTKADARGNLVAKFDINEVKAIVVPGEAVFVLTGLRNDGVSFSGTDTVPVR